VFSLWSFVFEYRIELKVETGTSEERVQTEVQGIHPGVINIKQSSKPCAWKKENF
jgi:hypothetical protein